MRRSRSSGAAAAGLVVAARFYVWPSFRFAGAGGMLGFGLLMLGSHCSGRS